MGNKGRWGISRRGFLSYAVAGAAAVSAGFAAGCSTMRRPEQGADGRRLSGMIVDVVKGEIYPGTLVISGGRIADILPGSGGGPYLVPGLVDSHIHIESSMLVPAEFGRMAVRHGTVATVSDPHEIANVMGMTGIDYMIESGSRTPFKFCFGASSCVPATAFETAGAQLGSIEVEELLRREGIGYLSEMMNFPGVLYGDRVVSEKLDLAKSAGKKIDGHAPGLRGGPLRKYIDAGITTDHETFEFEEGREKLSNGMKVLIREGSAARNFDALIGLLDEFPDSCMFCSDDRHPHDLVDGHIDGHVRRALKLGIGLMKVLRAASLNPVRHYGLQVGLLQKGDAADFIVIDNPDDFTVLQTWIGGRLVAEGGRTLLQHQPAGIINRFRTGKKTEADFRIKASGTRMNVIEAVDGQLMTRRLVEKTRSENGLAVEDVSRDILKIAVVNRYEDAPPSVGFVRGFGLRRGALAASVAHDSHNILAVGASDRDIAAAVNSVIEQKGGMAVADGGSAMVLPLPVAGLMSDGDGFEVARRYSEIDRAAKELGSPLGAPFMTLSFMALLVIPEIKLSDKGLFDARQFRFMPLFEG